MKRVILCLLVAVQLLIGAAVAEIGDVEELETYFDKLSLLSSKSGYATTIVLVDERLLVQGCVSYENEKKSPLLVKAMTMAVCTFEEALELVQLDSLGKLNAVDYDEAPVGGWAVRVHNREYEDILVKPGESITVPFSVIVDKENANDVIVFFQEYSIVQ